MQDGFMRSNTPQTSYPGYPYVPNKYYETYKYYPELAYAGALNLIEESVRGEREDELFYNYMINAAPAGQKGVVTSIRDDEIKHGKMLREIYWEVTGRQIPAGPDNSFQQPQSYCEGISRALFGELAAVERYRKILFGFRFIVYRNMITEIYTDELRHSSMWNYLFALNCACGSSQYW